MKLLRADKEQFSFQINHKERLSLFEVLGLYPLVPAGHQKLSRSGAPPEDQQLLEEALAAQRKEHKRQVLAMMQARSRFVKNAEGWRFNLRHSQLEWLLQVLNDVRIGSWILLGSPENPEDIFAALNEKTLAHFWAMEVAGRFQITLLQARTGGGASPPPAAPGE